MEISGFDEVAEAFTVIPARMAPKIKGVVSKGALNVKKQLQAEASKSSSFGVIAASIGYDLTETSAGGGTSVEAEIGPQRERNDSAGLLGAYWGWSKGGGGSLPDPLIALEAEAPNFLDAIFQLTGELDG